MSTATRTTKVEALTTTTTMRTQRDGDSRHWGSMLRFCKYFVAPKLWRLWLIMQQFMHIKYVVITLLFKKIKSFAKKSIGHVA
jgi:hypothetical protein